MMEKVFLIRRTVYGNDFTDEEIVLATLNKEFADKEFARLENAPKSRNGYGYEYELLCVTLTDGIMEKRDE